MEHEDNNLFHKFPLLKYITGLMLVFIAVFSAFEWNDRTQSWWGYVFFAIAVPGVFLPFVQVFRKFCRDWSNRNKQ